MYPSINRKKCIFRSLHTREKSIHRQLYLAMLIQVVIRLILYTDQYVSRQEDLTAEDSRGIDNTVTHCLKITQNVSFEFFGKTSGFLKIAKTDYFWHF